MSYRWTALLRLFTYFFCFGGIVEILCLIGSLRKDSYNRKVFEKYREIAGSRAVVVEGNYRDFPLYNSDLHETSFPRSIIDLGEKILFSDGILFFSPEYNYSLPGPLKNAIDWISRLEPQPFANKPTSVIGASPGRLGTSRMQYHLRQMAVFVDLVFLNKPEVMISEVDKVFNESGVLVDPLTQDILKKHFEKFHEFVQEQQNVKTPSAA